MSNYLLLQNTRKELDRLRRSQIQNQTPTSSPNPQPGKIILDFPPLSRENPQSSDSNPSQFHYVQNYVVTEDGSRTDVYSSTGAILADTHAQSESCFGVFVPFRCHHLVLYSRCYARQLRAASKLLQSPLSICVYTVYTSIHNFSMGMFGGEFMQFF